MISGTIYNVLYNCSIKFLHTVFDTYLLLRYLGVDPFRKILLGIGKNHILRIIFLFISEEIKLMANLSLLHPTPSKIATAALISLHSQESSPFLDNHKDDPTNDRGNTSASSAVSTAVMVESYWLRRNPTMTTLTSIASSSKKEDTSLLLLSDVSVAEFLQDLRSSGALPPRSEQVLLHWFGVAASSVDAFIDLMTTIQMTIVDGGIDEESTHGIFLRSLSLGWDQLSFERTVDLWMDFKKQITQLDKSQQLDTISESPSSTEWMLSADQIETNVRNQCDLVLRKPMQQFFENSGTIQEDRDDCKLSLALNKILEYHPELPSAHFLRFLHCLQTGERVGAVDALHSFLDYAFIRSGNTRNDNSPGNSNNSNNNEVLKFASILEAALLHHPWGDTELVQAATEEAVRVAQQSHDTACVAFALGWLSVVNVQIETKPKYHQQPQHSQRLLLLRAAERALEAHVPNLVAGANLSLAKSTHTWEFFQQATTDRGDPNTLDTYDRPMHILHIPSYHDANQILARQRLVAAGMWNHFGETGLALHYSKLALQCHGNDLAASDVALVIENIAKCAITSNSRQATSATSDCIYGEALRTFVTLRESHGLPLDGIFHMEVALILHEWAVRRNDFEHAEALIHAIESQLHPRLQDYDALCVDIVLQKALLLSRQNKLETAKSLLLKKIHQCKADQQNDHTARLLLQLAIILQGSDGCTRHFATVLPLLLECLDIARNESMKGLHAAAMSILAQVHLIMGDERRAMAVLRECLPTLLQREHVWLQAEAYFTLAKCHLKRAQDTGSTNTKQQNQRFEFSLQTLNISEILFLRCQDSTRLKDIYYLSARINNELENEKARNDAAEKFAAISRRNRDSSPTMDIMAALTSINALRVLMDRKLLLTL